MEQISKWFWSESFWFPEGYTWKDFEPTPKVNKPSFTDLYYVPVIAVFILCTRYAFERFLATPFCLSLGLAKARKIVYEENPICEHVFKTSTKKPDETQVSGLAKQLGWSVHKVKRWFRRRRKSTQVPLFLKATECCWRCVFYFWLFCFGGFSVLRTDWFYDTREWMKGYIREQDFNIYLRSYYLMELSFYASLLFSQFLDTKRKDFYQMFLHHVVTILLIFSSYAIGHHRIGVAIMFLHDATDFWLEAAKVFNYAKWQKTCDSLFVMFALTFLSMRWIYYPFWVLHCIIVVSWEVLGPYMSYYYFTTLLCTLQVLHLYWGSLIVHMVFKLLIQGKVDRDTRSEDESSDGDEKETSAVNSNVATKKKK